MPERTTCLCGRVDIITRATEDAIIQRRVAKYAPTYVQVQSGVVFPSDDDLLLRLGVAPADAPGGTDA